MKCRFCGKFVGLFKDEHPECRQKFEKGKNYIRQCIDYVYENRNCVNIRDSVADAAIKCNIPQEIVDSLIVQCWNEKVDDAFADNIIADDEIQILREIAFHLGIPIAKMQQTAQGKKLFDHGQRLIRSIVWTAIRRQDLSAVNEQISDIARKFGYNSSIVVKNILRCYNAFLDEVFEDGVLDEKEEAFFDLMNKTLPVSESDTEPYRRRVVKGLIIRELLEGKLPQHITINGIIPFVLQKGEAIIWIFNDVRLYEDKTFKHYEGGYSGVSVRIARGVYYRTAAFKGYPVETTESVLLGDGNLFVTNKHIYFSSSGKCLKIPVKKITALIPKSDGIIVQKDGVRAKPQTFLFEDTWFAYNLISNLNLIETK